MEISIRKMDEQDTEAARELIRQLGYDWTWTSSIDGCPQSPRPTTMLCSSPNWSVENASV